MWPAVHALLVWVLVQVLPRSAAPAPCRFSLLLLLLLLGCCCLAVAVGRLGWVCAAPLKGWPALFYFLGCCLFRSCCALAVLCCAVLCCAVLCCAVLCCAVLQLQGLRRASVSAQRWPAAGACCHACLFQCLALLFGPSFVGWEPSVW